MTEGLDDSSSEQSQAMSPEQAVDIARDLINRSWELGEHLQADNTDQDSLGFGQEKNSLIHTVSNDRGKESFSFRVMGDEVEIRKRLETDTEVKDLWVHKPETQDYFESQLSRNDKQANQLAAPQRLKREHVDATVQMVLADLTEQIERRELSKADSYDAQVAEILGIELAPAAEPAPAAPPAPVE